MPYQLQWRKLRFDREMLGQMVRYGLPSGVQNSVIGLANVILQSNINSFGKLAMAGYGAYSKLEGFAFLPITSFTMALTTYTGQNLGAMQYDRAKKGARFGILVSITLAELIGVGMYVFAPQLISIFTPTPESSPSARSRREPLRCSTACWPIPTPSPRSAAVRARLSYP